ncbi:ryanodine receptor-like isoform X6 [Lineus longissimus]|uniref:ryanodine receptor-like isoform X6 n=1 Tax=Lineus longissimus TaxID=88925 RepID=UPI00315D69D6
MAEEGHSEQDDVSFLRTDDMVCMTCVAHFSKDTQDGERVCLAAEGFGNRMCFLENTSNKNVPPDLSVCIFVLEQALSVRALQEMVSTTATQETKGAKKEEVPAEEGQEGKPAAVETMAAQSGHRTLLYGHAVLLRHLHSNMYLTCLSTSSSNDKLAFDVGLHETAEGESCWWTIHPASKQRSEGEKVRVGDDLILVSVASERYLHIGSGHSVIASFQQTLWTVAPVCSGAIRQKSMGMVFGSDVVRLFHGHMDECLTIPQAGSDNEHNAVMYETGAVCSHARSLWRIEHNKLKWAGGFMTWGSQCRLRHVTSGRYLAVGLDNQVISVHRSKADEDSTLFYLRQSKDDRKHSDHREDEGMGSPDIKYGDSMVFIQHCQSNLWLSYQTYETKKRGVGRVEEKKAVMLSEGHMDDGFTLSRAQEEESRSARVIRKCISLFSRFIKALNALKVDGTKSPIWQRVSLSEVNKCLEDLIEYFVQPAEDEEHEEKQAKLKALRNRQDLFQEEGMIALVLETIDKVSQYKNKRHFAHYAGEDNADLYDDISSYLYLLLAAMIKGNRANCSQFAQSARLDWLVNRLESQQSSKGVLDVLHCVLIDSPEALNMIKENHIRTIISLIDKHGRDPKVLEVLCSLCVGNDVAVRTNQNLICDNLLPGRDLLLQTKVVDEVTSVRPNVFVGLKEGSPIYRRWYYEMIVDDIETVSHTGTKPHIRVGWADTEGYQPYPGGGEHWGGNGVGDDLYSYGFDGQFLWTGGVARKVRVINHGLQRGDIVGCYLDLGAPSMTFEVNGIRVKGIFRDFNLKGMFFPIVSLSSKVSCRFILGGEHGRLRFGPHEGFAPVCESLLPKEKLKIEPCFHVGDVQRCVIAGPGESLKDNAIFVPNPVDTSHIQLPTYIESVRDKLAENTHELWAMSKIENGWTYSDVRDDARRKHPCLTTFERLPQTDRQFNITVAFEMLRTLLALGYHISIDQAKKDARLKTLKLPQNFLQTNGYRPTPLDLSTVQLTERNEELVDLLAENTHMVWARDRIKQGWTYGHSEDAVNKRSPFLVPYSKCDENIKRANRETASESVKTLIAFGYNLDPPTNESGESGKAQQVTDKKKSMRLYRAEYTYAVTSGKWYYEFEVITPGDARIGWAKITSKPNHELGSDDQSYVFDGFLARKWHQGSEPYGKIWQRGDTIGCMLDLTDKTVSFSLNGELMMDHMGQEIAFKNVDTAVGYVPAFYLGCLQQGKLNFGQDVNSLKYFTCCGLQEGYEPFCVNMTRNMPLWYGKEQAMFIPADSSHPRIEVNKSAGGGTAAPCLRVVSKTFGTLEKSRLEFLRLSLPVKTMDRALAKEKSVTMDSRMNMENLRRGQMDITEEGHERGYNDAAYSSADVERGTKVIAGMADDTERKRKVPIIPNQTPIMQLDGGPHGRESAGQNHHVSFFAGQSDSLRRIVHDNYSNDHGHGSDTLRSDYSYSSSAYMSNAEDDEHPYTRGMVNGDMARSSTMPARGFSDDMQTDIRRQQFRTQQGQSYDDSMGDRRDMKAGLRASASETMILDPAEDFLGVPKTQRSSSKFSLLEKFHDTSKAIADKAKADAAKQAKSPFAKFKKQFSKDPSMGERSKSEEKPKKEKKGAKLSKQQKRSVANQDLDIREMEARLEAQANIMPVDPEFGMEPENNDGAMTEQETRELEAMADQINSYFYGIRIFPGQDPANIHVGWVTSGFHTYCDQFDIKNIRNVVVCQLDAEYRIKQSVGLKNCYMVSAGTLQQRYGGQDDSATKRQASGVVIGCVVDTANGQLSFTFNGREVANKFHVDPGTKLYPAVFCEPTSKEMFQFELGRRRNALPLSACLFRSSKKDVNPQCPPRLDIQIMKQAQWSRVPDMSLSVHTLKMSDIRGWSMLCENPVSFMALHIPEEDKCLDIRELSEHTELLNFHAKSLYLYWAVCSHGNHKVAHTLIKHIDVIQFMYCITNECLPGPLRMGYHNLLICMHLETHAKEMLSTQNEYIIPMEMDKKNSKEMLNKALQGEVFSDNLSIPGGDIVSIRPELELKYSGPTFDEGNKRAMHSPAFPIDDLKRYIMKNLNEAVKKGHSHIRDPIGGTSENLFVPILRVCDNLLVMGVLDESDTHQLMMLIDPKSIDVNLETEEKGLLNMKVDEPVKLELCRIMQHLCDCQLRRRVEILSGFSADFVKDCQNDQKKRYNEVKQADLPMSVAAKKTREFRCPPVEQMRYLLHFKADAEDEDSEFCSCTDELKEVLRKFHDSLLTSVSLPKTDGGDEEEGEQVPPVTFVDKINALINGAPPPEPPPPKIIDDSAHTGPVPLCRLISNCVVKWGKSDFIENHDLVREMFSLLHRQYDGLGELMRALDKTYVISAVSHSDVASLLKALGTIRLLLSVQVDTDEEALLKTNLWTTMDNKIFFQHPDLMRALCVHETVMQLMVNTLTKAQSQTGNEDGTDETKDGSADMVVTCCRFLCYFCRTGRHNQRAMFEHLAYMLENSGMLLSRPSLRGSCPLDVAYSSLMDNNELALALRESNLERITQYLARCGVQANIDLINKGYPDIGWDPVEGERFLDFLRFCVWVNGESVEENANLVVRLLIRRPECLGPALRGEGGGLLKAIKDGIKMSEQIAAAKGSASVSFLAAVNDVDDSGGQYLNQRKYDFSTLPPQDDEDYIDIGDSILGFYTVLVDLLGRCAPESEAIKSGRSDALRARAILRSLVSMEDLEGVLALRFILPTAQPETVYDEDGEPEVKDTAGMPPGLLPIHKSSIVMFLERVYGVDSQETFFRLLEEGFLPDMRAAVSLDTAAASESDMALALNRYLCNNVLPLLTTHAHHFSDADHFSDLLDSTLQIAYRLSNCKSLTKGQRECSSDFMVALTSQLRPPMMTKLLKRLTVDVPSLTENTVVSLRVLNNHYERCGRYYGSGGWGSLGSATEEEKRLTMVLFSGIFDSLAKRAYDPELFSKALPCLSAIGCALSPDYALTHQDDNLSKPSSYDTDGPYVPRPVDTNRMTLNQQLEGIVSQFVEHYHDSWATVKLDEGWEFAQSYDDEKMTHPFLKPVHMLSLKDQDNLMSPVRESLKTMLVWGCSLDLEESKSGGPQKKRRGDRPKSESPHGYNPQPVDLRNVTLSRENLQLAEKLTENVHAVWAQRKIGELSAIGEGVHPRLVAYDLLTDMEKQKDRNRSQELLKFMQMQGYRIQSHGFDRDQKQNRTQGLNAEGENSGGAPAMEKRFAYSLLQKLLEYVDKAALNLNQSKPSTKFSRRNSYSTATEDVKFFGKVVLPLVEKYFRAHRSYFVSPTQMTSSHGTASAKEKEMTCSLFCKLAALLRVKITAFGHDVDISVRCLQVLVQAIDARSVVKNSPEIVRSSLLPFFNHAAHDLNQTVQNLKVNRFSHVKGTISRGATSINYVHMVLLPVLSSMFEHLGRNGYGSDLLLDDLQLCCYRILNALYTLGTSGSQFVERHRPILGECVASFASTFPVAFLEPDLNKYNKNSVVYGIEGKIEEHSLEAREVMESLAENLPLLDKIVQEIEELAESGGKYAEAPHVIEVTLPMLCSYLPFWWCRGPDSVSVEGKFAGHEEVQDTRQSIFIPEASNVTTVTAELMNKVLGNVMKLIKNNIGSPDAPWMTRIATRTQPIIVNATADMLREHILPVAQKLKEQAEQVEKDEEEFHILKRSGQDVGEEEGIVQEHFQILVRDIYAFYPLLIKYVDLHRSHWLKHPTPDAEELYQCVADIFYLWSKSPYFKREETNFMTQHEINNMALIMPSNATSGARQDENNPGKPAKRKREKKDVGHYTSLNTAALKRLLPLGLNKFGGQEQELVQQAKQKLIEKEPEAEIEDYVKMLLQSEDKLDADSDAKMKWQKLLYKKIGETKQKAVVEVDQNSIMKRVINMAKVLHGLYLVDHPPPSLKNAWRRLISSQKKRAVMACFRMIPLHNLPRHRVVNLFLKQYQSMWLEEEEQQVSDMIEDLTKSDEEQREKKEDEEESPDPLKQLITTFQRTATTEQNMHHEDFLYMAYAEIMSKSCHTQDGDDDDEGEEGDTGASFQLKLDKMKEQEMEKMKTLFEQGRLSDRGAAEMVLLHISACKGEYNEMVARTIELGISLLLGGNVDVQKRMLKHLKEKKDIGFFTSVAGLMQQCSVLDLDAFERTNKAEGLGMAEGNAGVKNLHDAEFTCKLFRFLQLLCEGHNLDFQNYLRTQAGNNTTINIIISTVDYLLRIQESIMDFYWHYSGKDTIDAAGKESFCRAIKVSAQVFATLTEDIQGPCLGNQLALAHSRLWDAVGGFLYIFAHMQEKLSKSGDKSGSPNSAVKLKKDPDQLELLREFMTLQKEMMIMLLSMLEGNVVNGPIGKQMVDTLVESSTNMDMILKFFDIFLKMKDLTTSEAFLEFDTNGDGFISRKEFQKAMDGQKMYSGEEIDYIMMCVDTNQDGKVDFLEFTDRFHNPAKDIGFNVAVLLTNLSEHMPNDPRLERLVAKAKSVLDYFVPFLGRIEIQGSAGRIERVYFEVKQSHIDQWLKPQIRESKRTFIHNAINEGGDKEKLEFFVDFCEDTIFEMQHATSITAEEPPQRAASSDGEGGAMGKLDMIKAGANSLKDGFFFLLSFLTWTNIKGTYTTIRGMSFGEMIVGLLTLQVKFGAWSVSFVYNVVTTFIRFIAAMMMGDKQDRPMYDARRMSLPPPSLMLRQQLALTAASQSEFTEETTPPSGAPIRVFGGVDLVRDSEGTGYKMQAPLTPQSSSDYSDGDIGGDMAVTTIDGGETIMADAASTSQAIPLTNADHGEKKEGMNGSLPSTPITPVRKRSLEAPTGGTPTLAGPSIAEEALPEAEGKDAGDNDYGKLLLSFFARNFYNFKLIALVFAFFINFMLLFFKVSVLSTEGEGGEAEGSGAAGSGGGADVNDTVVEGNGEEAAEPGEMVTMNESVYYFDQLLMLLAFLHSLVSLSLLVAYYCLKVPLVVFKREKEICRLLEFEGMWVSEQPSEDNLKGHWDKLALSTKSFPNSYWDKFVKKKVRNKYSEQYDYDEISNLLGMEKKEKINFSTDQKTEEVSGVLPKFMTEIDWQYSIWKWGVIITDNSFQYNLWYFLFSVIGNFNYFFFAAHLLDVAISFKTLRTILQSVTHNGKQLVLTVMLTSVVVYIYTVIAFNFFRKFYVKEEDGNLDMKCHDMAGCFVYHLYAGVRAGGGIGDEIESADGDPYESWRILFDITFFFFVIVILLAIIQGLIIDAFGELRDQLEQVKEDMESKCFICGIGKDYFDKVPHGFERHVMDEHNFANYMFFLMHLINKPDTEYTGQETFVWEMYQERCWDFFPVGDCFRKQYEDVLQPQSS